MHSFKKPVFGILAPFGNSVLESSCQISGQTFRLRTLGSSSGAQKQTRKARTKSTKDSVKLSQRAKKWNHNRQKTRYQKVIINGRSPWNSSLAVTLVSKSARHVHPGGHFLERTYCKVWYNSEQRRGDFRLCSVKVNCDYFIF